MLLTWTLHEAASSKGLTEAEGPTSESSDSHGWQEASGSFPVVSKGLLECPLNMATSFPRDKDT